MSENKNQSLTYRFTVVGVGVWCGGREMVESKSSGKVSDCCDFFSAQA